MNKNIHGCKTSFSDWITDYVESEDFQKQQEQTEPMKMKVSDPDLFESAKHLLEGQKITVLQRKNKNEKSIRPEKV
jgi:hypothetical protein